MKKKLSCFLTKQVVWEREIEQRMGPLGGGQKAHGRNTWALYSARRKFRPKEERREVDTTKGPKELARGRKNQGGNPGDLRGQEDSIYDH